MPVFLFTFHAYGSWMPDHEDGYTQRRGEILPKNERMAALYQAHTKLAEVKFTPGLQDVLIDESKILVGFQSLRLHAVATETTHLPILVSWRDERHWELVRDKVKESLHRRLNRELSRKQSLSEGASRRHVEDQDHFNYLMYEYLPSHSGKCWFETNSE